MKLAEALLLRGDTQKRLASLRERLSSNALVEEGNAPSEDPMDLLEEAVAAIAELEALVVKINVANLGNKLPDGRTITAAIAHRDSLILRHAILQSLIGAAQKDPNRYSTREIMWVATVDVRTLQKQSQDVSRQIREINARIQETNWQIEV